MLFFDTGTRLLDEKHALGKCTWILENHLTSFSAILKDMPEHCGPADSALEGCEPACVPIPRMVIYGLV